MYTFFGLRRKPQAPIGQYTATHENSHVDEQGLSPHVSGRVINDGYARIAIRNPAAIQPRSLQISQWTRDVSGHATTDEGPLEHGIRSAPSMPRSAESQQHLHSERHSRVQTGYSAQHHEDLFELGDKLLPHHLYKFASNGSRSAASSASSASHPLSPTHSAPSEVRPWDPIRRTLIDKSLIKRDTGPPGMSSAEQKAIHALKERPVPLSVLHCLASRDVTKHSRHFQELLHYASYCYYWDWKLSVRTVRLLPNYAKTRNQEDAQLYTSMLTVSDIFARAERKLAAPSGSHILELHQALGREMFNISRMRFVKLYEAYHQKHVRPARKSS